MAEGGDFGYDDNITITILTTMMMMNMRSTGPSLFSLAQRQRHTSLLGHQIPTTTANRLRCTPCETSRAGYQIPLIMKKALCLNPLQLATYWIQKKNRIDLNS